MGFLVKRFFETVWIRSIFWGGILLAGFLPTPLLANSPPEADPRMLFLPAGSTLTEGEWHYDGVSGRRVVSDTEKTLRSLSSYRCQVATFYHESDGSAGETPDEEMILSVRFPGQIRVDLLHPRKGAWLIFRSDVNEVRVKPFTFLPMVLSLNPDSSLITSRFGHTINHADYRSFDSRVLAPACLLGGCVYLTTGVVLGHPVRIVNVAPVFGIARPMFGRMWVAFDEKTYLPVSISTINSRGEFMERILYTHCSVNPSFPKGFFHK